MEPKVLFFEKEERSMQQLVNYFLELPDYRKNRVQHTHPGLVLFTSLLAMLAGAEGYDEMHFWIKKHKRVIAKLLGHPFKAPAIGTIWKTFNFMDMEAFAKMMAKWSQKEIATDSTKRLVVSADGKHLRDESDKRRHMLSLFLNDAKLVLAHTSTDTKSNEIPAMLELLKKLDLKHCIITMDAMHAQKKHCRGYAKGGMIMSYK